MRPDSLMKRFAYHFLTKHRVFKTWYKTAAGEWTENPDEADWRRWHGLTDGALCCDVRHESYWLIDGMRYDNMQEALEAAEAELLRPYLPILVLDCERIMNIRNVI